MAGRWLLVNRRASEGSFLYPLYKEYDGHTTVDVIAGTAHQLVQVSGNFDMARCTSLLS